ncbi:MAG: hydrogenase expression/formation protein [Gammaproteobacteria bacterium]|nr:hydrogenase expression/formation protein [Gammaproteobacteria bacterium]
MSSKTLADIKVHVEDSIQAEAPISDGETGNLQSILTEIKFALEQLLQQKKSHSIDLRAMPWSPGEQKQLEEYLGKGEVQIKLNALGKSNFYETQYSGVWMVTHYNPEGEIISQLIEITTMPEMLFSCNEDIKESIEQLN